MLPIFSALAFGLAFLIPNHYYPWGAFYLEFSAFLALFMMFLHVTVFRFSITVPVIFLFFFFIPIVPVLQWLFGAILFLEDAVLAFFYLSSIVVVFCVVCAFPKEADFDKIFDSVAAVLVVVGFVSVWIALIQWLELDSYYFVSGLSPGTRPYANLAQPNNFSSLIWLSIFSIYYLYERKFIRQSFVYLSGFFLVCGPVLAQSRTSWVILFVFVVVSLFNFFVFNKRLYGRLLWVGFLIISFYFFGLIFGGLSDFLFKQEAGVLRSHLSDIRLTMWKSLAQAVFERPWFGWGWGQVPVAQFSVAESYPPIGMTQYSHNIFVDFLLWNGLPIGLALIFVFSFFWLKMYFGSYTARGFLSFSGYSVILAHSLLEYPHAYSYFLILAMFFVGASVGRRVQFENYLKWLRGRRLFVFFMEFGLEIKFNISRLGRVVTLLLFLLALVICWRDYRIVEQSHRQFALEEASISFASGRRGFDKVIIYDRIETYLWVIRMKYFNDLSLYELGLIENLAIRMPLPIILLRLAQARSALGMDDAANDALLLIALLHGRKIYESAKAEFLR